MIGFVVLLSALALDPPFTGHYDVAVVGGGKRARECKI